MIIDLNKLFDPTLDALMKSEFDFYATDSRFSFNDRNKDTHVFFTQNKEGVIPFLSCLGFNGCSLETPVTNVEALFWNMDIGNSRFEIIIIKDIQLMLDVQKLLKEKFCSGLPGTFKDKSGIWELAYAMVIANREKAQGYGVKNSGKVTYIQGNGNGE